MSTKIGIHNIKITVLDNFEDMLKFDANPNELTGKLDFAFNLLTPGAYIKGDKVFLTINKSEKKIYLDEETVQKMNVEIFQGSVDFSKFIEGQNYIEFFYETTNASIFLSKNPGREFKFLTSLNKPDLSIGTMTFFLEKEDNTVSVSLQRPDKNPTSDEQFWNLIKRSNLNFKEYRSIIDRILCNPHDRTSIKGTDFDKLQSESRSPFVGIQEYNILKFATEAYMLAASGIPANSLSQYLSGAKTIPYYDVVLQKLTDFIKENKPDSDKNACDKRMDQKLHSPFLIELIWSYWMEQGMLVQTLNLISLRFQNIRGRNDVEAISRFDVDPLRPLGNILWGYIQDEQHRLSIPRRLSEYNHEYGLILTGRAVPKLNAVDTRSKFLEAFHNLLNSCALFYKEADDTTRIADAFPVLNNLKEVHLLLAEGNHNAYGNLTWTARHEMMMQQYILARGEMREFMGGRVMVPYNEPWMDRVDTMRGIQGWGGTSITYFHELATYGEQILLSCRFGNWGGLNMTSTNAKNWAMSFRDSIQRYIHAYRVVTGIDLSSERVQSIENLSVQPAYLISERALQQNQSKGRRAITPAY